MAQTQGHVAWCGDTEKRAGEHRVTGVCLYLAHLCPGRGDRHKTRGLHTGKVTGSDEPKSTLKKGYDFQSLLTLFSPISKEKAIVLPNEPEEIDSLFSGSRATTAMRHTISGLDDFELICLLVVQATAT